MYVSQDDLYDGLVSHSGKSTRISRKRGAKDSGSHTNHDSILEICFYLLYLAVLALGPEVCKVRTGCLTARYKDMITIIRYASAVLCECVGMCVVHIK